MPPSSVSQQPKPTGVGLLDQNIIANNLQQQIAQNPGCASCPVCCMRPKAGLSIAAAKGSK